MARPEWLTTLWTRGRNPTTGTPTDVVAGVVRLDGFRQVGVAVNGCSAVISDASARRLIANIASALNERSQR